MAWDLAPPSWEAAATLITGGAAVIAALAVGIRQAGISRRQADIQAEQTRLQAQIAGIERTRLRMEMFERRHEVYASTFDYLGHFLMTSSVPRLIQHEGEIVPPEEFELARRFRDASHLAPFVFRPEVDSFLKEIRGYGRSLSREKRKQTRLVGKPGPELTAAIEGEQRAADALENCDTRLIEVFGPEMRLGESDAGFPPDATRST